MSTSDQTILHHIHVQASGALAHHQIEDRLRTGRRALRLSVASGILSYLVRRRTWMRTDTSCRLFMLSESCGEEGGIIADMAPNSRLADRFLAVRFSLKGRPHRSAHV